MTSRTDPYTDTKLRSFMSGVVGRFGPLAGVDGKRRQLGPFYDIPISLQQRPDGYAPLIGDLISKGEQEGLSIISLNVSALAQFWYNSHSKCLSSAY